MHPLLYLFFREFALYEQTRAVVRRDLTLLLCLLLLLLSICFLIATHHYFIKRSDFIFVHEGDRFRLDKFLTGLLEFISEAFLIGCRGLVTRVHYVVIERRLLEYALARRSCECLVLLTLPLALAALNSARLVFLFELLLLLRLESRIV